MSHMCFNMGCGVNPTIANWMTHSAGSGGATGNPKQTHAEAHGKGTPPPDPPKHEAQTTRQTTGDRRQTGRQTDDDRQTGPGSRRQTGRQAAGGKAAAVHEEAEEETPVRCYIYGACLPPGGAREQISKAS